MNYMERHDVYTLQKVFDIGPSFLELNSSCSTFFNPLLIPCISSARNFNWIWIIIIHVSASKNTVCVNTMKLMAPKESKPLLLALGQQDHWRSLKLLEVYLIEPICKHNIEDYHSFQLQASPNCSTIKPIQQIIPT